MITAGPTWSAVRGRLRGNKFNMLFYMQMRNWFLIFLMLTIAYMIQQKSGAAKNYAYRSISSVSIIR